VLILFPSELSESKKVDSAFLEECRAAESAGHDVGLINQDELDAGNFQRAVARVLGAGEEAVNLLTEVALENVLNIVMNNFPPECKVSEYLDDILVTLDSCQSDFGDYKVVKETVEVNTLEMEVLRAKWHAQLAQDFKDWDQSERDQKEKEERAQLTKLKAKYE